MFAQAAPALERAQGGLGLGLSLVRGLVELHGGRVEVRSDGPERGSEFIVRLPVAATAAQPPPGQGGGAGPRRAGPNRRILVVDDNEDTATSLGLVLQLAGHDVRTAHDGLGAVRAAEEFRPDVVVLDIGLPKLNGYEAARQIRRRPWGRDLLLVAVTGWGQEQDKRQAYEAGFDHHLTKPVDPGAVLDLLAVSTRR
jgi:CheY-like chemotaxis protein